MPNPLQNAPKQAIVPYWIWLVFATLLIISDQSSKLYFEYNYLYGQRQNLLPFFDFILVYNTGAAFSFLAGGDGWQRWFFIGLGLIAAGVILYLLKKHKSQILFCISIVLIMAGALGNIIDRLMHGHVIDFLLFYYKDWYFPAFNLADTFITIGAILLILDELLKSRAKKRQANE